MEITNALRKTITSLSTLKGRRENNLFVVEGTKGITETLPYFTLHSFWATPKWVETNRDILPAEIEISVLPNREFERLSFLKNPQGCLAVYQIPEKIDFNIAVAKGNLILALDGVQDPGNLGTIIRVADWFGIRTIVASENTADNFSPKVVQATMGAIGRVNVCYCDLAETLRELGGEVPVFGTFLDGENIFTAALPAREGVIVMGNEGNGISAEVAASVTRRLLIPSFPASGGGNVVESLNVGTATAITVAEFRRRLSFKQ